MNTFPKSGTPSKSVFKNKSLLQWSNRNLHYCSLENIKEKGNLHVCHERKYAKNRTFASERD